MQSATDKMIAALVAFNASPNDNDAVYNLYNITEGFEALPDKARVIPAMFSLMERCVGADLGSPGPLVHCIESVGSEHYLAHLLDSLRRQPTYLTVWMVNRILNSEVPQTQRKQLLNSLEAVVENPAATPTAVEQAKWCLERHRAV
jgi:hypothetical protein